MKDNSEESTEVDLSNDIKKILEISVHAPSGDNSQPWKFILKKNIVYLYNLPDRDNAILNFNQSGSYIAHGALIENIFISSPSFGLKIDFELFPNREEKDLVAILTFKKEFNQQEKNDSLFEFVTKRCTNRKPYERKKLVYEDRNFLISLEDRSNNCQLTIEEDSKKIKEISHHASVMEKTALENRELHKLFFKDIVWTESEEKIKKKGLFIKTLELPRVAQYLFRILRFWSVLSVLNIFGFSKIAAMGNSKIYSQSSAFFVITVKDLNSVNFINAGRLMQRIWLKTTKINISLQLVTGLLFLSQRLMNNELDFLDSRQVQSIKHAYLETKKILNLKDEDIPVIMFRVGYSDAPSAFSSRMDPNIVEY